MFLKSETRKLISLNSLSNSYRFSSIEDFIFNQPEINFTNDQSLVFFDGKGSIIKVNKDLEEIWKVNYYTKKEKK